MYVACGRRMAVYMDVVGVRLNLLMKNYFMISTLRLGMFS